MKQLNAAINEEEKETEVYIGPWDGIAIHETMSVNVSLDKMKAIARFYPPSEGGKRLEQKEIEENLMFRRISYGIDEKAIEEYVKNHPVQKKKKKSCK